MSDAGGGHPKGIACKPHSCRTCDDRRIDGYAVLEQERYDLREVIEKAWLEPDRTSARFILVTAMERWTDG